jgi:hypothetical protein
MTNPEATPPTQELPILSASVQQSRPFAEQQRYRALAAAVRRHELVGDHPAVPKRPADHALYGVLNEIEAVPPIPGDEPS